MSSGDDDDEEYDDKDDIDLENEDDIDEDAAKIGTESPKCFSSYCNSLPKAPYFMNR